MSSRLITLATVALCAAQLHVSAATFQPVEEGLRPLYVRMASIDAEMQSLETTLTGLDPQAEERLLVEEKIKTLKSEKERLARVILQSRKFAESPLVMF